MDKEEVKDIFGQQQNRQQPPCNDDKASIETVLERIGSKGTYGEREANAVDIDGSLFYIFFYLLFSKSLLFLKQLTGYKHNTSFMKHILIMNIS